MEAQLQRLEVEPAVAARSRSRRRARSARGSCALSGSTQLGEVAVERLLVAALDEELVAVAEHERAEAVPLRLEDPARRRPAARRRAWRASAARAGSRGGPCYLVCAFLRMIAVPDLSGKSTSASPVVARISSIACVTPGQIPEA